jgi:hypothetical protein
MTYGLCLSLMLAAAPVVFAEQTVCLDAVSASFLEAPMEIASATNAPLDLRDKIAKGASGGRYLEIAQGKGNPPDVATGKAVFTIDIPEDGDYILWCRTWWSDECGNSFFINLDEAKPFTLGEDSTFKTWHWVKAPARLKQLTLTKGPHTLTVRNREDGVKLNQVLLTNDKQFVPVDVETVTVKAAAPAPAAP